MYLIMGDSLLQEWLQAVRLQIMFKTPKGKEIRGWVQCNDADGC
jgi:hypothetical protein